MAVDDNINVLESDYSSRLKKFIDFVEIDYEKTWDSLVKIKNREFSPELIMDFQIDLATVLMKIEEEYQYVAKRHNYLLRNKNKFCNKEYNQLKEEGDDFIGILSFLLSMGKSFGDAFAWLFYQNETTHLEQHLVQQENLNMPSKQGGFAEFEFIKTNRMINGYFVLYHNITNFLRLGDVSLISRDNFKLVGLGELKSHKVAGTNNLNIRLHVIGHKSLAPNLEIEKEKADTFKYANKEKFNKQIKKLTDSFSYLDRQTASETTYLARQNYCLELESLVNSGKALSSIKVDRGMAMVLTTSQENSLSERIMSKEKPIGSFEDLESLSIYHPTAMNYHLYGSLQYDEKHRANLIAGMQPLFWCKIDLEVLKKIYFRKVLILTVYNPAFFVEEMSSLGFKLSEDKKSFTKIADNKNFTIEGINYYFRMITDFLHSESTIVDTIKKSFETLEKKDLKTNARAIIHFKE